VNTLKTSGPDDFNIFYPTTIMNTAYEILFLWVARMIMFGIYLTGKVPFKTALINGVLRDEKGAKMSKSIGNGVNPNEAIDKYGADAVRMALLAGRDNGNDLLISKQQMEEKIKGYRNFSNKIWNAARYIKLQLLKESEENFMAENLDSEVEFKLKKTVLEVTNNMEKMRLGEAAEIVYADFWHWFCDEVIEQCKAGLIKISTLKNTLNVFLKLLHPFMPFVTEAVWAETIGLETDSEKMLISSRWPEEKYTPLF
jgi:valyl-tRNA synthetase